jgi:hypothetical protein
MKWLIILFLIIKLAPIHIVTVDMGVILPIQEMDGLSVPIKDDTLGLIDGYPAVVFVAHDNLAGNHIEDIIKRGYIFINYSDGLRVRYNVDSTELVPRGSNANKVYNYDGVIFQTCEGDEIRIIRMKP